MIDYSELPDQLKTEIRKARQRAIIPANTELLELYWRIGRIIPDQEQQQGWGQKVVLRLVTESTSQAGSS